MASSARRCRNLLILIVSLALFVAPEGPLVRAQEPEESSWSEPLQLFEDEDGWTRRDYMIADPFGAIHIFWYNDPVAPDSLFADFTQVPAAIHYVGRNNENWMESADILLESEAQLPFGAAIDQKGILHIASVAAAPTCVSYLQVPADRASDPRGWSQTCLQDSGRSSADLAIDADGVLYVLYPDPEYTNLKLVKSNDGGNQWSLPIDLAPRGRPDVLIAFPRLAVDAKGTLHAVWGELTRPSGYPWMRLKYSRSTDAGTTWSVPMRLTDDRQGEHNLAVSGETVHVVWNGDAAYRGRYYRASTDGGLTWSPRLEIPALYRGGGLQGPPAIVVDAEGIVHLLYSNDMELYYVTRRDSTWSQPELIAGPENTGVTSELNNPNLAITEGNILHAAYTRDAQSVYYQYLILDVPHKEPMDRPRRETAAPSETPSPTPAPTSSPTPVQHAPLVGQETVEPSVGMRSSPLAGLAIGLAPVLLLISFVALAKTVRSRRSLE